MKVLTEADQRALLRLLDDEDPRVVALLEEQFLQLGEEGTRLLEQAGERSGTAVQILQQIRQQRAYAAMEACCRSAATTFDLETGCWLLARTRDPQVDDACYRSRLDQMAQELRERLTGREPPRATLEVCTHYLFRLRGFRGNTEDYYHPDNSYLDRVLDNRLGIPISLSVVYLLIGYRLRMPLQGIGLPGHFLIQWPQVTTPLYVDPFHEGRLLGEEDCRRLCEQLGYPFRPAYLTPSSPRRILARMCRNLEALYVETDPQRTDRLRHWVRLLTRTRPAESA